MLRGEHTIVLDAANVHTVACSKQALLQHSCSRVHEASTGVFFGGDAVKL
jgi:hypothetical protein